MLRLHTSQVVYQAGAYPCFCSMKRLGVFQLPSGWDASPSHPSIKFPGNHLYTWVERGNVGVECLALEHNTMSPGRARTQTNWFRDECTSNDSTVPPSTFTNLFNIRINSSSLFFFGLLWVFIKKSKATTTTSSFLQLKKMTTPSKWAIKIIKIFIAFMKPLFTSHIH